MMRMIATLGGIQVLAVIFNVLRAKALALLLGPEGIGATSIVDQASLLVLQISAIGLPFASVRFLSRAHSQGAGAFRHSYSGLLSAVLALTTLGSGLALVVVFIQPAWLGADLGAYRGLLVPALLSVPAMALQYFMVQALAAGQQARLSAIFLLVIAMVQTVGAVVGTQLAGVFGYYWATMFGNYLLVLAMLFFLKWKFSLPFIDRDADLRKQIRMNPDIVSFTLIMFSISYILPLSNMVARLAVLRSVGEAQTGLMQAAIGLATALNLVLNPANGLYLTPMMNRAGDVSQKISAAIEFQRKLLLVMPLLAIPMVLFARMLISLFYSQNFIEVSQFFYLFVVAQFLAQLAGVGQAALIGINDLIVYVIVVGLSQLSLGVIAWGLTPALGIYGVAGGYIFSSLAILVLCSFRLTSRFGWSISKVQWALGVYGLVGLILAGLLFRESALDLKTVVFATGYFLIFSVGLALFFGRQELRQVLARFSRSAG